MPQGQELVLPKEIIVWEVGPRDGLQNEKNLLTSRQKLELINEAVTAGIKNIEIGSFVSSKAVPQMADTEEVAKKLQPYPGVSYRALVLNLKGLERAKEAGLSKVKLTASASLGHSLANSNKTPEEVVLSFAECAEYAAKHGLELSGALAVTFGCSFDGKIPLSNILSVLKCFHELGIKELSLSDTTGMANPQQVYTICKRVQEEFPDVSWTLHFHNTRGLGLANVYAGLLAGITTYDACFAGLGGCPFVPGAAGNIATEDLVNLCEQIGIQTGVDLDKQIALSKKVRAYVGHETDSFVLRAGKTSAVVER